MQPISAHRYGNQLGAKTAPCRTCGKTGQKPLRRRRRQQRSGGRLTLERLAGEAVRRYAQR